MPKDESLECEINRVLSELERVLDSAAYGHEGDDRLLVDRARASGQGVEKYQLVLECSTSVWQNFVDYCKRNELDPAQQLREAVVAHYRDMLQAYKLERRDNGG